nr:MAG TPA: hypothetical protein [Caudoviricetes sp.]
MVESNYVDLILKHINVKIERGIYKRYTDE